MLVFVIKNIREKKKISLYKLSQMTGVSRTYLRDLEENLKHNPSVLVLMSIASALNVNIKTLFYSNIDMKSLKKRMYKKSTSTE